MKLNAIQNQAWEKFKNRALGADEIYDALEACYIALPDGDQRIAVGDMLDERENDLYDDIRERFMQSDELRECGVDEETMYQTRGI